MHVYMLNAARQQAAATLPQLTAFQHLTRCLPSVRCDPRMGKQKIYAVRAGRLPGIYGDWASCQQQVNGYPGAVFKSFACRQEAEAFLNQGGSTRPQAAPVAVTARTAAQGSGRSRSGRFYAIAKGLATGVFHKPWAQVEPLVKNYTAGRPSYRGFDSEQEAWEWLDAQSPGMQSSAAYTAGIPAKRQKTSHDTAAALTTSHNMQQQQHKKLSAVQLPQHGTNELMVTMYFDGGSRGNPGRAGYGYAVFDSRSDEQIFMGCRPLRYGSTNNEAEYTGMIQGMKCALDVLNARHIVVLGDSQLVVKHMTGEYRCKAEHLSPLLTEAKALQKRFSSFQIQHVYRDDNKLADQLSNLAMDTDTAVDKVVQAHATGADRAELVQMLAEAAQVDSSINASADASVIVNSLRTAPRFILAAATMLSSLWDHMPVPEVIAWLTERGWDEGTGGPPVPALEQQC